MEPLRHLYTLIIFLAFCLQPIHAQEIFPGDADNNGRVEHYDLLYIGYAYGSIGPGRLDEGLEFSGYPLLLAWDLEFPDGHNFAFADSDGNGQIDLGDMLAVYINYGLEHDYPEGINFATPLGGGEAQLQFNTTGITSQLTQGSVVQIPILLGTEQDPIENFNGIAFTLRYDSQRIQDIWVDFLPTITDTANQFFYYQSFLPELETGKMDIAITRFGPDPIAVAGEVAMVNIVIEDNLIDFISNGQDSVGVLVSVDDIKMVNELFDDIPVSGDSLNIIVYHPNAVTGIDDPILQEQVRVFPNPVKEDLYIQSAIRLRSLELLNLYGQEVRGFANIREQQVHLTTSGLAEGFYFLKIHTENGTITRKILINGKK